MQIAVRHNLQVFDPADPSLCESGAIVLPIAEAQAAMGETVAAYLARVAWRFDLPTVCRINGEFYARAEWETRALAVNDNVEFVSRPLGGGSNGPSAGKTILSVVALVALTAVSGPLGGAIAGAAGLTGTALTVATSIASAVIVGAGSLAISHFLQPKSGGKTNSTDALYSFGLQGNAARPMQPIPVLNGRLRFAPDYAAPTYSEYAGDAMTDYALYALTCGRMRVEQLLIGDTPIWHYESGPSPDYPGIEIQIVEPGAQVTLYPVNVVTADELSGAELATEFTPGYIVNAAGTQAKQLLLDFVWPGGAYVTFKDRTLAANTDIEVQARTVNDAGAATGGWVTVFQKVYSQAKQSQIRVTERVDVAPGRYEVRGRRRNPSVNDSGIAKIGGTDDVTWTALRAHIDGPQSFPRVTTLAVKGVASKQLSGVSGGQMRVIGTRILPVWRDGQFVEEPTRSIAWAALDWWRNGDYAAGLSISDIEFSDFVRHAALWDALGHTFDHRFTEVPLLDDVLETVLKAGRAFPAPVGDKLTITRDEPRALPRMLFTDNDIVRDTLEIDYALSDEAWADGMVGEYVDETTWRLAEVSSAPDGVVLLKPARVQLEGVVNRKQAAGMVRMMAAESQYRRITVSWTARMEGRLLKRGDLVRITTEEPETWGQSCEVVGFQSASRRLTLDPAPAWEAGANHYAEIRRRDGSPWGPVRVTRGANDAEAIVSVSQAGGVTLADAVGRSDTQEPAWLAFSPGQPRSFPVLITDGDPDQDGEHIHLSGVIDAAEVYTTNEDGVPPLLQIPDLFSSALPVIAALMANIAQRQAALILTAGWQPAKNAVSYEAQVSYDNGGSWIGAYEGDRTTFEAVVGGSDQMMVRVRGVTVAGPRGAWSIVRVEAPSLVIDGGLIDVTNLEPLPYEKLGPDAQGLITAAQAAADAAQEAADAASQEAASALASAYGRLDDLRRALAADPSVRIGFVDAVMGDVRKDISLLNEATFRLLADVATLRDNQAAAGIEILPDEGRVRIAAVAKLEAETGQRLTSLSVLVDALKGQIDLYGSVQGKDVSGLVTDINAVRVRLDAVAATVSTLATSAQFDGVSARLGTAEQTITAQGAAIEQRATLTTVNAQGVRLSSAETRISATEGSIRNVVTAAGTSAVDLPLMVGTLAQMLDYLGEQTGGLYEHVARAETATSANFDEAGRSVAEVSTRLLAFQGDTAAQFVTVTRAIAGNGEALVQSQTLLSAQVGKVAADVTSEIQVRAAADAAQTTRIDGAVSRIGTAEARIVTEEQTRASETGALSQRAASLEARTGTNEAGITSLGRAVTDNQSATASQFQGVNARFGTVEGKVATAEGNIQTLFRAYADGDSALSQRIDTTNARVGGVEAGLVTEQRARADAVSAQAERTTRLEAQTDGDRNFLQGLGRQTDSDRAYFLASERARIDTEGALSQQIGGLGARVGNNEGTINQVSTALSNTVQAQAGTNIDLYARSDAGTAFGRIRFEGVSAPAGVAVRFSIQLSTERNGFYRNSGLFMDILGDGSSRILFDANLIAFTANGGTTYPFRFTGAETYIDTLRVGPGNLLPNSISQSNAGFDPNSNSISFKVNVRPGSAVLIFAEFYGQPDQPLAPGQQGILRIARDGVALRDKGMNYYVTRAANGNTVQTLGTEAFYRDVPPPGERTYTIAATNGQAGVAYTFFEITGS
ncbi:MULTISPECIES: host specificity factor TipJ family phage tail protein [Methylorubrum]|uniref:host specificity factor TipJ family phage tail protein n=1 Tax=Methylorubrum TaxID=2282523 RepID=UPI0020A12D5F|nr:MULTISPECIES: host specificity factor TipJ family phage tail protein [Methylorubrum]MCP1550722.1 sulfur carrier protein ThiS [Methylorubrum zatmanii]MCP1552665.1 sulfur carrier protein ThiS [Methylorubrum extorquens]MCP1581025.1 sulfur carrier protein ThiS [Methylorubrum extorquens]